jgi:NADH-quinone oxidoreductase subunit M
MLQRGFFGPLKEPHHNPNDPPTRDLNAREWAALVPILALCVVIGVYPQPLLNTINDDVEAVAQLYEKDRPWLRGRAARERLDTSVRATADTSLAASEPDAPTSGVAANSEDNNHPRTQVEAEGRR